MSEFDYGVTEDQDGKLGFANIEHKTKMSEEDQSTIFEVVCLFHPTDYDKVGHDGLYIKEIRKWNANEIDALRAENDALKKKLEVAKEALKKIRYEGMKHPYSNADIVFADKALAEIEKLESEK